MIPRSRLLPRPPLPLILIAALAGALLLLVGGARAAPPDDPEALAPRVDRLDDDAQGAAPGSGPLSALDAPGGLSIGLQAGAAWLAGGERGFQAMLLASIPLERFARGRAGLSSAPSSIAEGPRLKPPRRPAGSSRRRGDPPDSSPSPPSPDPQPPAPPASPAEEPLPAERPPEPPPPLPVRVTPELARAAVGEALRRARLADPDERVDALASRARTSALLPELRLRVARELEQEQRLAPTDDDPLRTTASGGASFWLEARATWRLDRVVFSDDEVALERVRRERAEAQRRLADRVLELLFAWQRARAREADPALSPEERLEATLAALEAEATLDVLTGGWFTRRRRA